MLLIRDLAENLGIRHTGRGISISIAFSINESSEGGVILSISHMAMLLLKTLFPIYVPEID